MLTFDPIITMQVELIHTGFFYADGGAMFGSVPKTAWSRRYPSDEHNGCIMSMSTLLIKTKEGRIVLVDTGAGSKHLKQLSYYRFFNLVDLHEELAKRGIMPEQVDDVILTHLHFDHCGYLTLQNKETDSLRLAFPNARHWVSQKQWDNFLAPNPLECGSFFPEDILPIKEAGLLHLIENEVELYEGISLSIYDGHTPGQIVPYIKAEEYTIVFAGDVIPLAASVSPEWISAYDTHPVTSYYEKVRLLEKAVAERQVLVYCHDAYTSCSSVKKISNFYKVDKAITL